MGSLDLDSYRQRAEEFVGAIDREYYLHFSGQKDDFRLAEIYGRYSDLFSVAVIDELRTRAVDALGSEQKMRWLLLGFAVDGYVGEATRDQAEALAAKEATLEIKVGDQQLPYRQSAIVQANESDAGRRAGIEQARLAVIDAELNPLYEDALQRSHQLAQELGWPNYRTMYEELKGIDFDVLHDQTSAFDHAVGERYGSLLKPQVEEHLGVDLDQLRRCDIPYFLRGVKLDSYFPGEKLVAAFRQTMSGLGIDLEAQDAVVLDVEERPNKSPRAFCAPVRVPDEVYLVVPRIGGREDYFALFHEGGHTEHYAHVDGALPFEFRYLGDNSVTEAFAFLFHHLVESPRWLEKTLGIDSTAQLSTYSQAAELIYLRRYAAKLTYELELHGGDVELPTMRKRYSALLSSAVEVEWPEETFLADVDPGFYVASYLRAWALEAELRGELERRFGEEWFAEAEAGSFLKKLWSYGQRLNAEALLAEINGRKLDFSAMSARF